MLEFLGGGYNQNDEDQTDPRSDNQQIIDIDPEKQVKKVSEEAVTGLELFTLGGERVVLYAEQATGHIYSYNPDTAERKQLTNKTLPQTKRVTWGETDDSIFAVIEYIQEDEPALFSGRFTKINPQNNSATSTQTTATSTQTATTTQNETAQEPSFIATLEEISLSQDVLRVTPSPDKTQWFILEEINGEAVGVIRNLLTGSERQVFRSPYTLWVPKWINTQTISLQSRSSAQIPGFAYVFNTRTGELRKILGDENGLYSLISPNISKMFQTKNTEGRFLTGIYDIELDKNISLQIKTLTDKCTWTADSSKLYCGGMTQVPAGQYPDDWFKGRVSFDDEIWKFNLDSGEITNISDVIPSIAEEIGSFDVINPQVSTDEQYLLFTNKKDSSGWVIELPKDTNPQTETEDFFEEEV